MTISSKIRRYSGFVALLCLFGLSGLGGWIAGDTGAVVGMALGFLVAGFVLRSAFERADEPT